MCCELVFLTVKEAEGIGSVKSELELFTFDAQGYPIVPIIIFAYYC